MWGKRLAAIVICGIICFAAAAVMEEEPPADAIEFVAGKNYYEKTVAITFDDGPRARTTSRLLDGLKERGVKATFFVVGQNIEGNEELIKRMYDEGHVIGNHTYTHVELNKLSKSSAINEIVKTNEAIEAITGEPVKFIRPPCGAWDEEMYFEVNMTPVFWSVDPKDWCTGDVTGVVSRVMGDTADGDIILFHDIYDSSVTAALEVIDRLQSQGYKFVTIENILIE